jgi:hypothetical protein
MGTNGKLVAGISIGLVVGLVIGIVIGVFFIGKTGLFESYDDYTRIVVFSHDSFPPYEEVTIDNVKYRFIYKYTDSSSYDASKPIMVVAGPDKLENLPATTGALYDNVWGIRIIVSAVFDDYVVLLLKAT